MSKKELKQLQDAMGLVHQNRGRPSNRRITPTCKQKAVTLLKEKYLEKTNSLFFKK
jgi:hypothetical protein